MKDAYTPKAEDWLLNIVDKGKKLLNGVKTQWISFDFANTPAAATPLRIIDEIQELLRREWPTGKQLRILVDRLDDSWDASADSKHSLTGLLKATNALNYAFPQKLICTVFIRSDIYGNLVFGDMDKLRQNEEMLYWSAEELRNVVSERVRVSLGLPDAVPSSQIWSSIFSNRTYRSKASAQKYITDRTFKRPRDMILFVRFALEQAIKSGHSTIEPEDTRLAEEQRYSQSKLKDLLIENEKRYPFVRGLLESFSGSLHKISMPDLNSRVVSFIQKYGIKEEASTIIRLMFTWGVIGVKKQGRSGVSHRGGAHFFYYYDDPAINPLSEKVFYIHPSLRHYLNISEKRERREVFND